MIGYKYVHMNPNSNMTHRFIPVYQGTGQATITTCFIFEDVVLALESAPSKSYLSFNKTRDSRWDTAMSARLPRSILQVSKHTLLKDV